MSDIVIKAESLGKKYIIGHQFQKDRYVTLRDVIARNAHKFWRVTKDMIQGKPIILGDNLEEVWALKDVNFSIHRGEIVGIIGRNGAGKSTLLKVLSRITEPSAGKVTIKGRVSSLLEVGTGFHPELTGRENVYLNGAILGMSRREVSCKFDEIVAFAEVERYLDTPVKRYSSGMYVRLAFAVAAHLEPEILLVDEVLAVGDTAFQKKCMGKMGDASRGGKTVLFVSHNMASIMALCPTSILIEKGSIVKIGPSATIIQDYYDIFKTKGIQDETGLAQVELPHSSEKGMSLVSIRVKDSLGNVLDTESPHDGSLVIEIDYLVSKPDQEAYVVCCFTDIMGTNVLWQYDAETAEFGHRKPGFFRATVKVPKGFLRAGIYYLRPAIVRLGASAIDYHGPVFYITIDDRNSVLARKGIQWPSSIKPPTEWHTEVLST